MKARQLLDLHCPFCSSTQMKLSHVVFWQNTSDIRFGLLHCDCDVFPVFEGIVVLRRGQQVVVRELLASYRSHTMPNTLLVLQQLIELRLFVRRAFILLTQITMSFHKLFPEIHKKYAVAWWRHGLTLLTIFTADNFLRAVFSYFRDRDQRPSYVLVSAVLPLLNSARMVVEVGGGAGHLVRVASQQQPRTIFYSLEKNFWLVYWLVCNQLYRSNVCPVVMDFEGGLPLPSNRADVVMANDTIMYVNHQRKLATEMKRIMRRSGWVIGMHIHQAGQENVAQGNGVFPAHFLSWLQLPYAQVYSDDQLFQRLWKATTVSFTTKRLAKVCPATKKSFSFIASQQSKSGVLSLNMTHKRQELNYVEDQWSR